jgi:uncharacterized protein (DUF4415 family)
MTEATPSVLSTEPVAAPAAPVPTVAVVAPAVGDQTVVQEPVKPEAPVGAPEKYEAFKTPEGIQIDQAVLERFSPLAKELGLTQEAAQKLIDFQSEYALHAQKTEQAAWDQMQTDWVNAAKTDKEIGGPAFNENVGYASKAIKQFGTAELKAAMDATGVGNHPEFIRVFAKIGKAMSEDKFLVSNAEVPASPKSWAETLFGPNK